MANLQVVIDFLRSQHTLSLATTHASGLAHVAPVFYLMSNELNLYWFSSKSSEHSANIARYRQVSGAVYRPTMNWKDICGVQLRGRATVVADSAQRNAIAERYRRRFQLGAAFRVLMARSNLYRLRPEWIRYVDNSTRLGFRQEFDLEAAD